jgi:replicative DNA helicase
MSEFLLGALLAALLVAPLIVVLLLYRDDYYNPNSDRKRQADVIIAKHRNGPTGTVSLYFDRALTQFHDLKRVEMNLAHA